MMKRIFGAILVFVALSSAALADDWVAKKLRGGVFVFQSGAWVQIKRGHVVSDDSAIQTAKGARVMFVRGKESIDVRGDTRIRISDRTGAKRTIVSQDFGEITVDVEKRNVQHFEVRAPLLAAVVKGTKFTVNAENGQASIKVVRGRVEARDNRAGMKVDVKPRQEVKLDKQKKPVLTVEGRGAKEPIRSTSNDAVLSVRQVIQKIEKARPASPVTFKEVQKIAKQQGKALTKSDLEFAAAKELKAAKKSGSKKAIVDAIKSINFAENGGKSQNTKKAKSTAAAAQNAEYEKDAAEQALKNAKKSGDKAAIEAAKEAVDDAKVAVKETKEAVKEVVKESIPAAVKQVETNANASKDTEKAAKKAAKEAKKTVKKVINIVENDDDDDDDDDGGIIKKVVGGLLG